jgi:hypothetical protein
VLLQDFSGFRVVADIGGGYGRLLQDIIDTYPGAAAASLQKLALALAQCCSKPPTASVCPPPPPAAMPVFRRINWWTKAVNLNQPLVQRPAAGPAARRAADLFITLYQTLSQGPNGPSNGITAPSANTHCNCTCTPWSFMLCRCSGGRRV